MGYGIVHIWIMNERCRPAVGARWVVNVFDCYGQRPLGYVSHDEGLTWSGKTECYNMAITDPKNPHLAVKVPPGCYKVDAWQDPCHNPVHETMVVLPSLAEVNVYLITGADGWLRRILPVIEARARMRPIPPVEPPRPPTTHAKPSAPQIALKEEEVNMLSQALMKIKATIPIEEKVPIAPEVVDCLIKTVESAETKEALKRTRQFLIE